MSWVKRRVIDRLDEPSTYAGLAAVIAGLGQMFQITEAAPVADAVNQVAQQPSWQGAVVAALGLLAVFKREKAK